MKALKIILIQIGFLLVGLSLNAQITFNACHAIIENQDYTFNQKNVDGTGRNVFETDPVIGDQDCGGIGVCEMQIVWNDTLARWEILADDGNGTFSNTYVLYFNSEASEPNPPSLALGTWVENTSVTASLCVDGITTLTGDVQDTILSTPDQVLDSSIRIHPNPVTNILTIDLFDNSLQKVNFYDARGRQIEVKLLASNKLDVTSLSNGLYLLELKTDKGNLIKKILVE